ncbi:hypothetical protein [Pseudorhodobacter sp. MZDSW-24AT]|uniref:hypothetical protein n=1 Tax=Pseudorhodobacter sp. MZDSW-24AT TaxID=2052957 RepID=UPI0012FDAF87|nr:hypothetical protein [Pseudorhodobacter sp. MZDSW-24AT]
MAATTVSFLTHGDKAGRYAALDEAVGSMVSNTFVQGRFRIEMPVIMASGSASTVTVWPEGSGDTFMVSDEGVSLFEVMTGAFSEPVFRRVARERCEHYGAVFDGSAMIYLRVSGGRLRGAIIAMANLMKEVVDETIARSVEQKTRQIDLQLWEKLEEAFGGARVERKAHLAGESSAVHEFTALVQAGDGLIAFDTFSAQGNSINSVYVKMSDVGRSDIPIMGIAVTRRLSDIGPKLNLVTSVAKVIEVDVKTKTLQELAFAA